MKKSQKQTEDRSKQPKFIENAFQKAEEKVLLFQKSFEENHFRWLQEIFEEASKAFCSGDAVLLPKTPSMRRKRKRVNGKKKTSKANKKCADDSRLDADETYIARSNKTRANKRVKIGDDALQTSLVDLDVSNILDNSSSCLPNGRQLRPRKAKNGKPPPANRKKKVSSQTAQSSVNNSKVVHMSSPISMQKVTVEAKFIDQERTMKTPGTPECGRSYFSMVTPENKVSSIGKAVKGDVMFQESLPDKDDDRKSNDLDVEIKNTPVSVHAEKVPVKTLELNVTKTPVRIGTPNSLQPKVAAIVKQFSEIDSGSYLSSSPKDTKKKTRVRRSSRLSSKFANRRRSSAVKSYKKLKGSSKTVCPAKKTMKGTDDQQKDSVRDELITEHSSPPREVLSCSSSEDGSPKGTTPYMEGEEQTPECPRHCQTFTLDTPGVTIEMEVPISTDEDHLIDTENKCCEDTSPNDINADNSQTIKRKTFDVHTSSSSSLVAVEIPLDVNMTTLGVCEKLTNSKNEVMTESSGNVSEDIKCGHSYDSSSDIYHASLKEENLASRKDSKGENGLPTNANLFGTPTKPGPKIAKGIKSGNILSDAITSFIKKNTPKKDKEKDKKKIQEQGLKRKEKMHQRNLEIIENKRKQELEERKRRREERERRVAEIQAMRAREEEEKKRALQERMEKVKDKEEKARKIKEREEEIKRKMREKKQAEVEARRKQEEEERMQKLHELEMEEKRKQEFLARKAEYEEQERIRRMAEQKRLEEQKLHDIEQERRLQEDRWRREIEEKMKRKEAERRMKEEKELEKKRREKEEREKRLAMEREKKADALSNNKPVNKQQSEQEVKKGIYQVNRTNIMEKEKREVEDKENRVDQVKSGLTDKRLKEYEALKKIEKLLQENRNGLKVATGSLLQHTLAAPSNSTKFNPDTNSLSKYSNHSEGSQSSSKSRFDPPASSVTKSQVRESSYVSYDIHDMSSGDSTDDDDDPMHRVPSWAQRQNLWRALLNPEYSNIDPDVLFAGLLKPPKLELIFSKCTARFFKRTSSACWDSPLLKNGKKLVT